MIRHYTCKNNDSLDILLKGTALSVPFNIVVALLLVLYLHYINAPMVLISTWLFVMVVVCLSRIIYSKLVLKNGWHKKHLNWVLSAYIVQVFITSLIWCASYFLFLPYIASGIAEALLILVLGGMCVGSLTSLSAYLPAFYAFLLPIFLPIIIYNYLQFDVERFIMASLFLCFVAGLIIFANVSALLWNQVFNLSKEKDDLIEELQKVNIELEKISITDPLTGLYNRRHFDEMILQEYHRARRNHYPFNLVLIDVDNFKELNDNFGHPHGDKFLVNLSDLFRRSLKRANDQVFRLGGDEFAVILANCEIQEVKHLFTSVMKKFNAPEFQKPNLLNRRCMEKEVGLSIGLVYVRNFDTQTVDQIMNSVDKLLYQAKSEGKNQIIAKTIN